MPRADAVFEGGGIKGIGLVGAVARAEELGYEWQNLAGASAGAIVASLLAAGYKAVEIAEILNNTNYKEFKDTNWIGNTPPGMIYNLIKYGGLYNGDRFEEWLSELLSWKGVKNFGDILYDKDADSIYRWKLTVIVSDITRKRLLVLPRDLEGLLINPDAFPIARAVRMSMSIPIFYKPIVLKGNYMVDGGALSNFPVWVFDSEGTPEWPTLGFKLVEPSAKPLTHRRMGPISLLRELLSTMIEARDSRYIQDRDFVRTITIPTGNVNTIQFNISRQDSAILYNSGYDAAEEFFKSWDFDKYINKFRQSDITSRRERLMKD
jgi:NTE family protein